MLIKKYSYGIKRPLVMGIQEVVGCMDTGIYDNYTVEAVKRYQAKYGYEETGIVEGDLLVELQKQMSWSYILLEIIADFEVGDNPNAWGSKKILNTTRGDIVGYGIFQLAKRNVGVLVKYGLQRDFDPDQDLDTIAGAYAQYNYFLERFYARAVDFGSRLKIRDFKSILLFVDSLVYGGLIYSGKPLFQWGDWNSEVGDLDEVKDLLGENFDGEYENKNRAFMNYIINHDNPLLAFAELRPRSAPDSVFGDQLKRRRLVYEGIGEYKGNFYDINSYIENLGLDF